MKNNIITAFALAALLLASCAPSQKSGDNNGTEIQAGSNDAIANTTYGKIAGFTQNGLYIFKGIPYAKANRFEAPTAPDSWEGVRSCRHFGPTSPQGKRSGWESDEIAFAFDWDDGYTGENCQRLNIWTPGLDDGKTRPVMVWLHGGGFAAGSGQELPGYDGANLSKNEDVVVVTLNHRLNALGFLDLSDFGDKYAKSGNAGMLDIVSALEWVRDNIVNFGGDPGNVTIFGQSGGGGKVGTLTGMPAAEGLFHKAIVQSGSMLRMMTSDNSRRIGRETAAILGLDKNNIGAIDTIPYEQLLAAGEKAIAKVKAEVGAEGGAFIFGWAPTVDGDVLPEHPYGNEAPQQSRDIPMMIGTTLHEFTASTYVPALKNLSKEQIVENLRQRYGDNTDDFLKAFEKAYPDYAAIDLIDTDFTFRPSAVVQAGLKAGQDAAPVYMYLFSWESPVMDGRLRSTHCMEIPFVFANTDRHASMTGGGDDARRLGDIMSKAWANFARTGNPNTEDLPEWPAFTAENGATMVFDNECKVVNNHDKELLEVIHRMPVRGF
ncbi:MAG: carboxylesterase/lipase family protein [Muribaculaceae bacterium]|nr:carboxylesterase/lipase family protein [Muribaculaceae bacterium]